MQNKPKKSLGQNFLTSIGAINKIIEVSDYSPDLTILEVGPGKGVLTEALLKKFNHVIAVEKDHELISFLSEKFVSEIKTGKLHLIEGDILELNPKTLAEMTKKTNLSPFAIVANIPYYITGQFLRLWLSVNHQPKYMVLMVQKEVAKRIVAADKKESLLSISVKVYGQPSYIETIKRGSFHPIPNVDSAILKIDNISKDFFSSAQSTSLTENSLFTVIKAGFTHKRKFLLRNLEKSFPDQEKLNSAFALCQIDPKIRAEDLQTGDWRCLARSL